MVDKNYQFWVDTSTEIIDCNLKCCIQCQQFEITTSRKEETGFGLF